MKLLPVFCLFATVSLPLMPAEKKAADYPATYAGGSLPLDHNKIRATLGEDEVVFMQGNRRIAVPAKNISEISCGTAVRRRLGASVLDVVPLMHLGQSEDFYVGVAWRNPDGASSRTQVLLKLNRGEYREFLSGLEALTGIKAIDTNQVPTVVRYQS